jgi:hypothetical protein
MAKSKGGYGKKADYETVVVRIPVNIKDELDKLLNAFYAGLDPTEKVDVQEAMIKKVQSYKSQSKNTRDWTKANELIDELVSIFEQ